MLLVLSLPVGLWLQPAPEVALATPQVRLLLSATTGPMLEFAYHVQWEAGRHRVTWRPPTRRVRSGEATATLSPAAGQAPLPWNLRGRVGWVVEVPAKGEYVLRIVAPAGDLEWRLEALAQSEEGRLILQPELVLGNNAPEPLAVDAVELLDSEGACAAKSEGRLVVEAGTKLRCAFGEPIVLTGRTVHRFLAGRGEVCVVFIPDAPAALEALTKLSFQSATFVSQENALIPATIIVSPDRGAEVNLGRSAATWVKRTLLDERRTNPDFDKYGRVQGYDIVEEYQVEALTLTATPVELEIVEDLASTWELKASPPHEEARTGQAVIRLRLEPAKPVHVSYTIVKHSGTRASR